MILRPLVLATALLALAVPVVAQTGAAPGIEEGQPFPLIQMPDVETGSPRSLADFRGRKVVLHVFASW